MSAVQADAVQAVAQGSEQGLGDGEFASIVSGLLRRDEQQRWTHSESSCVWSGIDGCSCRQTISTDSVRAAWNRELEAGGACEDRFFHFIWEGGVWLAYGLAEGDVRGVYCPSHNSERAARTHAAICSPDAGCGAGEIVHELPLAA
ncbi:MAG TPA: hypothetical protein VH081_12540 [Solirubrobacteraceae bacterium]|jgi:hypothetical protein|nr:hypothetical protein [Solirubrobacteraceae bacterium]